MNLEAIREYCRTLPHVKEDVKWEHHLCFLIGGKMFAMTDIDTPSPRLTFKCTPERAAELLEIEGIVASPYLARYNWVKLLDPDALRTPEIRECLSISYELVKAGLPKKVQQKLTPAAKGRRRRAKA